MGTEAKQTKLKAKQGQSKPTAPPDPLIEPFFLKISELLHSGKLTPDQMAKPFTWTWAQSVPGELVPFFESPSLSKLVELLKGHPWLYWHPHVFRQISYLRRLRRDEQEWERLGWKWQWDNEYGYPRPPKEVTTVNEALEGVVKAHGKSLFPGRRIKWVPERKKPGPKGSVKNPHPTGDPWTEWVDVAWLYEDFRALRSAFKAKLKAPEGKPPTRAEAKEWYRKLAQQVLEESDIWWSGLQEYKVVPVTDVQPIQKPPRHIGRRAPKKPKEGHYWLDTSVTPNVLKRYDGASGAWKTNLDISAKDPKEAVAILDSLFEPITEHLVAGWKPLNLDEAIDAMLHHNMGHTGHEGKPAYLAYAVLGALLGVTPEKIRNTLDNYRHRRRRKKAR